MVEVNGPNGQSADPSHERAKKSWPNYCKRHAFLFVACSLLTRFIDAAQVTPQWAVAVMPSGAEFSLEIAADPAKRQLGYMYREHVGPREGMLFLFDSPDHHGIWMKNCKTALDIIWLNSAFRVVDMDRNAQPCPAEGACPSRFPAKPARYVLEVAGGTAEHEKLQLGDRLVILAEPPLP